MTSAPLPAGAGDTGSGRVPGRQAICDPGLVLCDRRSTDTVDQAGDGSNLGRSWPAGGRWECELGTKHELGVRRRSSGEHRRLGPGPAGASPGPLLSVDGPRRP